jgi:vacuolar-type H+-ATPase subunit F/Vma7
MDQTGKVVAVGFEAKKRQVRDGETYHRDLKAQFTLDLNSEVGVAFLLLVSSAVGTLTDRLSSHARESGYKTIRLIASHPNVWSSKHLNLFTKCAKQAMETALQEQSAELGCEVIICNEAFAAMQAQDIDRLMDEQQIKVGEFLAWCDCGGASVVSTQHIQIIRVNSSCRICVPFGGSIHTRTPSFHTLSVTIPLRVSSMDSTG